jgi:hypothetical protein
VTGQAPPSAGVRIVWATIYFACFFNAAAMRVW